jgi:hypothetical protein
MNMQYDFTLKFKLPPNEVDQNEVVERLGESGCDDALVGIGLPGMIGLDFTREAESAKEAILSAITDVTRAIPGARLVEVGPDFVGLSDVASVLGVSRQAVRKTMLSHRDTFPAPLHQGNTSIWHLAPVLHWLRERGMWRLDVQILEVADTAMQVNLAKDTAELVPTMRRQVRAILKRQNNHC